jgi:hypothetical protein
MDLPKWIAIESKNPKFKIPTSVLFEIAPRFFILKR